MAFIKRSLIAVAALAGGAALFPGCSGSSDIGNGPEGTPVASNGQVGSLNLAMSLGLESFDHVDMTIHATDASNAAQPDIVRTQATGNAINVASQHATISAFAGALLPGHYLVTLSTTALVTNDGCSGSATVNVIAGTTRGVTVPIICAQNPNGTNTGRGNIHVDAGVTVQNSCDYLTEMVVDPLVTDTLAPIAATAKSSGTADIFSWSITPTTLGTFAPAVQGPGGASASTFTCGSGGGNGTLTVTLTKAGTSCSQTLSTRISCATACTDGVKNGLETGIDCGGGTCAPCAAGQACLVAADCAGGVCTAGICAASSCTDGVKNGTETGVDCGGSCATHCANGIACLANGDCTSAFCNTTSHLCAAPSCTDGFKNGTESDVDCGGSCGSNCGGGKTCGTNTDCTSGNCSGGTCGAVVIPPGQADCSAATSCGETGVGAGVHAPPCTPGGAACITCEAANCAHNTTTHPYCSDFAAPADKALCQAVLDCAASTGCSGIGATGCFCGAGVGAVACKGNPPGPTGAHGLCYTPIKNAFAALTATGDSTTIYNNITVVSNPGGAALAQVTCDFNSCGDISGTNECIPYCK